MVRRAVVGLALTLAAVGLIGCAASQPPLPPHAEPVAAGSASFTWRPFRWTPGSTLSWSLLQHISVSRQGRVDTHAVRGVVRMSAAERSSAGVVRVEVAVDGVRVANFYVGPDGMPRDAALAVGGATDTDRAVLSSTVASWQSPALKHFAMQPFEVNEPRRATVSFSETFGPSAPVRFTPDVTIPFATTFTGEKRVLGRQAHEVRSVLKVPRSTGVLVKDGKEQGSPVVIEGAFDTVLYLDAVTGAPIASHAVSILEIFSPARLTWRETTSMTAVER